MTKSLKIVGIVAGSVCAFMFAFLLIDFLVRIAKDGAQNLENKLIESMVDIGLVYAIGTVELASIVGLFEDV